ncbi:MAG: SDR family NAD(P)-dependent oxidoreductase [Candidatus Thermoplasmatota archaeon]|nr:SDR family NAD(P)-dependent oxidoreductase [Candidatus Thermoplasmatota archaeon]
MERVLVTGGLGFIGSHTVDRLLEEGYKVTVLDNLEKQVHLGNVPEYKNEKADYIHGDIRYRKHWMKALKGVDYIIHLAGAVGIGQSFWQGRKYMEVNVGGTATLFDILINNRSMTKDIRKIVVASSKSLYGEGTYKCEEHGKITPLPRENGQLRSHQWEILCPVCGRPTTPIPTREDKPPQNLNPYSLGKYATERMAMFYSDVLEIPSVALRYFNVYGPRQSLSNPYTGVVAIFLSRLKNNHPAVLFEDGKQMRDYIYVKDVADINVSSLTKGSGIYNVGTGKPKSLLDVVSTLNRLLNTNIEPNITGDFRPGDNRHDFADSSKLISDFNIHGFTDFERGMSALISESKSSEAKDMFEKEEIERKKFLTR